MNIFKLELTEQQLQVISQALEQAPYGVVAPVIGSINMQLQSQQTMPTDKERVSDKP